eukprot:TRINITY_DN7098_c0_g1_i1.p1 TRINITY_DN7098_c0_g1~~TRINITY_DN7098_c0_g1_i1.p1  ORF type:complete len:590 (+),score=98.42 TRINITY_DN7098_c0_g1_i1:80-1771(+)
MFSDQDLEPPLAVRSSWKKERVPVEAETQTAYEAAEIEAQTNESVFQQHETQTVEVQTLGKPPHVPDPVPNPDMEGYADFPGVEGNDDDKIAKFLNNVMGDIKDILSKNVHSFAFEGYDVTWEEEKKDLEEVHNLTAPMYGEADVQAVDTCWNSTGSIVAAAYGRIDLVGWCRNSGYVCCWNISKKDVGKADIIIEASSYISTIAFHPTSPSLLIGGCYTGEVILWDVQETVPTLCTSNLQSEECHRDPICRVMWLLDRSAKPTDINRFVICSASGDGKVLFWKQNAKEQNFDMPYSGYFLKPAFSAGGSSYRRSVGGDSGVDKQLQLSREEVTNRIGIQSMTVMYSPAGFVGNRRVPTIDERFIIGSESGQVYKATMEVPRVPPTKFECKSLRAGTELQSYDQHFGPVQTCAASPFERNLFLTASSDGCVMLRNILESTLLTLEPGSTSEDYIYCAAFSPFRPCVIALGLRSSSLVIYDLEISTAKPLTVYAGNGHPILALSFSVTDHSLLATADGKGQLKIWTLPDSLSKPTAREQKLISTPAADAQTRRELWQKMTKMVF